MSKISFQIALKECTILPSMFVGPVHYLTPPLTRTPRAAPGISISEVVALYRKDERTVAYQWTKQLQWRSSWWINMATTVVEETLNINNSGIIQSGSRISNTLNRSTNNSEVIVTTKLASTASSIEAPWVVEEVATYACCCLICADGKTLAGWKWTLPSVGDIVIAHV